MQDDNLKSQVLRFWEEASCGEIYAKGSSAREMYETHAKARYGFEPYILEFAQFDEGCNKDVLEIGVGMGADHIQWSRSRPKSLTGIDLSPRAVKHTKKRLAVYGFSSEVEVGDAENLPYDAESFDLVYSWGVLHHSPDTSKAASEVYRVLRKTGVAKIMIYHKYSLTGYMLWLRYGLLAGKPLETLDQVYWNCLESPGTKAYTMAQAREILLLSRWFTSGRSCLSVIYFRAR